MSIVHVPGVKPTASSIELGRGADGVVIEVLDHPEVVVKNMNHRFKLGRNRIKLELRVLRAVRDATGGRGATGVFDLWPRGDQEDRAELVEQIFRLCPNADVSLLMLPDPTFDNVRWGYTEADPEPRWILIDP